MAVAHVCTTCGIDLAGVAPVREPVYALLVKFCPECRGAHAVWEGGKHPTTAAWRYTRLLMRTLRELWGRVLVCAMALGLTLALASLGGALRRAGVGPSDLLAGEASVSPVQRLASAVETNDWVILVLAGVPLAALAGGALQRSLWRHLHPMAVWGLCVLLAAAVAGGEGLGRIVFGPPPQRGPWNQQEWIDHLSLPLLCAVLAPLGWPLGWMLSAMGRGIARRRWSRALRNARRRRRA
ncbi:MAG: hypothetical protein ACKVS8_04020 [Phycisphaerales bacterium]